MKSRSRKKSVAKRGLSKVSDPAQVSSADVRSPASGRDLSISHLIMVAGILILLNWLCYRNVLTHDFINYDDTLYVTENYYVKAGITVEGIKWAFTTGHASNWHPVTWLSHMVDCQIAGTEPRQHHLTNLILHTINSLLLFFLFATASGRPWRSAAVALLFAIHPLRVESVAWVAERKDVLSAFFGFLTIWAYFRYANRPSFQRYIWVFLFFCLGIMAKPMLVTFPFLFILLDVWPLNRISLSEVVEQFKRDRSLFGLFRKEKWKRVLVEKIPLLSVVVASSVTTYIVQKRGGAMGTLDMISFEARAGNAIVAYVRYLSKLLWPDELCVFYPHTFKALPLITVLGAALVLIFITVVTVRLSVRKPYLMVGWFWYIGTLVPVIGLVHVGEQSMADRYTYIPTIGIVIMLVWGIADLTTRVRRQSVLLSAIVLPLALVLVICTRNQVGYWKDSASLMTHTLAVTKRNYLAHNNLGIAQKNLGNLDLAMEHYSEAIRIKPNYAEALANIGLIHYLRGEFDEAVTYFRRSLDHKSNSAKTLTNLGAALHSSGAIDDAIIEYQKALEIDSTLPGGYTNLGIAYYHKGDYERAETLQKKAIARDPDHADAHNNLGTIYFDQRIFEKAIFHYEQAIRIRPDFIQAQQNLERSRIAAQR